MWSYLAPLLRWRLRSLVIGVILLGLAGVFALTAGWLLIAGLFFYLADMSTYVQPALVMSGLVFLTAVLIYFQAGQFL